MEDGLGLNTNGSKGLREAISKGMLSHAIESGLQFAPKVSLCTSRMNPRLFVADVYIRMRLTSKLSESVIANIALGHIDFCGGASSRTKASTLVEQFRWFALRSR